MDVAAGFDMVPRLARGGVDKHSWDLFIECVKEHYKDDQQVVIRPNHIEFNAGEHPKLPFEGHKFLRFSSDISGLTAAATNVESYIDAVTRMAKRSLGSRVLYWNEYFDMDGHYGWDQVHESIRSYNEVRRGLLCSRVLVLIVNFCIYSQMSTRSTTSHQFTFQLGPITRFVQI